MESQERCLTPLEKARRAKGLSQTELAKLTNLNQSSISRAEAGTPMKRKSARVLAQFFGMPYDEMHFVFPERYMEAPPSETSPISQAS